MKDDDAPQRPIGVRSTFDWFFILAVLPGVYMIGIKLNNIDTKLNECVPRSELVRWSIDLKQQFPNAPIFPPDGFR